MSMSTSPSATITSSDRPGEPVDADVPATWRFASVT